MAILHVSRLVGAEELIFEEDFNTDGDGTRYVMEGRDVIENIDGQIGPGFWDLASNVSFVGIPEAAPARRALLMWENGIDPNAITEDAFELFRSTIAWLVEGESEAIILYSSADDPTEGDAAALNYLEGLGYIIERDTPGGELPDPSTVDMVLKSSRSSNSSPNRFTLYPVPMLSYAGSDHDDTLLSSIGRTKTFDPGDITITAPEHPAAGGKSGPLTLVDGEQPFSTVGVTLPDDATVVATYQLERFQPIESLEQVDQIIAGNLAATKISATIGAADLIGDEFGVSGNWSDSSLRVPGNPIGGFATVGTGELEVFEPGVYSVAFRAHDGGRLRLDLDRDGLDPEDDALVIDGDSGLVVADVTFPSGDPIRFEWVAFNAIGDFGSEISIAFTEGGGIGAPVNADAWDLIGAPVEPPPVGLIGEIDLSVYTLDQEPIVEGRPVLVAIEEGGTLFGGGLIESPDGSDFIGGAALARFANTTGLSADDPFKLTFNPIDVSGHDNIQLSFDIAGTFVDFETADYLRVSVDPDGDGPESFETLVNFTGDGQGAITDGVTRVVREFQNVQYPIPSDATELVVRFEGWNTWFNEIFAFDNVRLTAGSAGPVSTELSIQMTDSGFRIDFDGQLEATTELGGSWQAIPDATSPFMIPFGSALSQQYFRTVAR